MPNPAWTWTSRTSWNSSVRTWQSRGIKRPGVSKGQMSFRSMLELDAQISNRIRVVERTGPLRNLAAVVAHSGDSWLWVAGLIILWFAGDPFWKKWAAVMLGGIVVLAVILTILKYLIRRRRPEGQWGRIYRSTDPHSFPSGHAARAFLLATLAAGGGPAWLGIVLIVW